MISEDQLQELMSIAGPCDVCGGKGSLREDVGQGEYRATACTTCNGSGTKLAAALRVEYVRGWDAAFNSINKSLTSLKRSHRL